MIETFLEQQKDLLKQKKLLRSLRDVSGSQGPRIVLNGQEVLNFCSNNYLGLADDIRLSQAATRSIEAEGFGSGASRLISGNMDSHRRLEQKIADFKQQESCLLFSSGYMANLGILSSLFGRDDIIFSDKLNHASIIDGIKLSQAAFKRYAHCDMSALEELLKQETGYKKRVIVTDSVFSMDGNIAPLDKIVALAKKYQCMVMVDEAHGLGVFGANGRGVCEHFGVEEDVDIQMGTLSKAAGSFGAYCCGSKELIDFLINKARSFIYTTAMPPSTAAASCAAIDIIRTEFHLRTILHQNVEYLLEKLKNTGWNTLNTQSPIIPIVVGDADIASEFSKRLLEKSIFISAIRPPTVPVNTARLRLTVMSSHTKQELDYVANQINSIGRDLCLI